MTWDRRERWEAILLEKIAVIVQQKLNDPRLGFVTVTRTQLSRDKRLCTVFYTVLGTDGQRTRSAHALADAAPRVQELLAPTLRMRTMPELRFVYDETIERESRILGLIDEVTAERRARHPAGDPDAAEDVDADAESLLDADDADDADDEADDEADEADDEGALDDDADDDDADLDPADAPDVGTPDTVEEERRLDP